MNYDNLDSVIKSFVGLINKCKEKHESDSIEVACMHVMCNPNLEDIKTNDDKTVSIEAFIDEVTKVSETPICFTQTQLVPLDNGLMIFPFTKERCIRYKIDMNLEYELDGKTYVIDSDNNVREVK